MQDFSFKTSKGAILKDMMGRPDTKKLIQKALSSPMGSTSRSEAKNIFSIMSKLNDKNDGVGGPGNVINQIGDRRELEPEPNPIKMKPSKGMVIFNRIPKSRVNYTIRPTKNIVKDGAGGPGDGRSSYSGPSISSYLTSVGKDPSFSARAVMAANQGIQGYSGTAEQNTQLLGQLRSGTASPDAMQTAFNSGWKKTGTSSDGKDVYSGPGDNSYTPPKLVRSDEKGTNFIDINKRKPEDTFSAPVTTNNSYTPPEPEEKDITTKMVLDENGNWTWPKETENKNLLEEEKGANDPKSFKIDNKGNGIQLDVQVGEVGGQCGRFVNTYLDESRFGDSFEQKMSNANTTDPKAGDVVIFDVGEFGHVAVIESINSDGSLNIVGSNTNGVNEKVTRDTVPASSAAGFYRPGAPTNTSSSSWDVSSAVSNNLGASGYAKQANELLHGKELRDSIYDEYGIKKQQSVLTKMAEAGATLPNNVTEFIKANDTALKDIDNNISDYINNTMANMDMSDPGNIQKAKAQLGYLYTLRGRRNQTYVGYLNTAVEQHQAQFDGLNNKYKIDLAAAQEDINDGKVDYDEMSAVLADMYTEAKEAPELALKMNILKNDAIIKEREALGTGIDYDKTLSYPEQKKQLDEIGMMVDSDGHTLTGVDIGNIILENDIAVENGTSNLLGENILKYYINSVIKTLGSTEKNDEEAPSVSAEYKRELSKEAIRELDSMQKSIEDNEELAELYVNIDGMIGDISAEYGRQIAKTIPDETTEAIMDVIDNDLIPKAGFLWRQRGTPLEKQEFIDKVNGKTNDSLDESIISAIYLNFLAAVKANEEKGMEKTEAAVEAANSMTHNVVSTEDRKENEQKSNPEFALVLGNIIAAEYRRALITD